MNRNLTLPVIVSIIFFNVSGGPYALEGVLAAGPGLALLLIVAAPVIWSAPVALVCAETGSALPEEGGYYAWSKRALGPFGAFCQGFWAWLFSAVNMAMYPAMFCDYLSYFVPAVEVEGHFWLRRCVMLAMIWGFVLMNLKGARTVGNLSRVFMLMVLSPFAVMVLVGIYRGVTEGFPLSAVSPVVAEGRTPSAALAAAIPIILWNFLGWDSISTIAGEMQNPARDYPRALLIAILLITAIYLVPSVIALTFVGTVEVDWKTGAWSIAAARLAGPWLGNLTSAMGMVAAAGLYSGLVLVGSRVPFVMGQDRFLPRALARCNRYDAPWVSLVICGSIYSAVVMTFKNIDELAAADVTLYAAMIALELLSFVVLRWREAELTRPYKVPGGWTGAAVVCALPLACVSAAAYYHVGEFGIWNVVGKPLIATALVPVAFPLVFGWRRRQARFGAPD